MSVLPHRLSASLESIAHNLSSWSCSTIRYQDPDLKHSELEKQSMETTRIEEKNNLLCFYILAYIYRYEQYFVSVTSSLSFGSGM